MRRGVFGSVLTFLLLICVAAVVSFAVLKVFGKGSGLTNGDIEKVVAEYIQKNPQAIIESVAKQQQNAMAEEEKKAQANIKGKLSEIEDDPSSPVAGNPKGDITIVQFFDYSCGYCKKVLPSFTKLIEEDKNIRAVFKEFPILGPNSELAARAALAVYTVAPTKYFEFHKKLMGGHANGQDSINSIAKELGINVVSMEEKMKTPEIDKIIAKNRSLAAEISIHGTPAFIIGGNLVPGAVDYDAFKAMVAKARESKKSAAAEPKKD